MSEVWDVENEDGDGEVGGGMLRRGWMDGWMDGVGLGRDLAGGGGIRGAWVVDKVLEWQTLSSPIYSI